MHKAMNENFTKLAFSRGDVAHRIISEKIRKLILTEKISPDEQIPPTKELAKLFGASHSTTHIALSNLVKEGLLERRHGSGTFVRERAQTIDTIGIYLPDSKVWTDQEMMFRRSLIGALELKLKAMDVEVCLFIDRREAHQQRDILPSLKEAVHERSIQGLLIPATKQIAIPALKHLSVAKAFITSYTGISNKISFVNKSFIQKIMAQLASDGAQSIGLVTTYHNEKTVADKAKKERFLKEFHEEVRAQKLKTKTEWIKLPTSVECQQSEFGYQQMHSIWKEASQPDAIIAFPDMLVRGVITAALELGLHKSKPTQFFFQRNSAVRLLCPINAWWAIVDTNEVADTLIQMVYREHKGEKISPIKIPFHYKKERLIPVPD
jgi:DNA-binding LacI/PurR family transcriptional regulator